MGAGHSKFGAAAQRPCAARRSACAAQVFGTMSTSRSGRVYSTGAASQAFGGWWVGAAPVAYRNVFRLAAQTPSGVLPQEVQPCLCGSADSTAAHSGVSREGCERHYAARAAVVRIPLGCGYLVTPSAPDARGGAPLKRKAGAAPLIAETGGAGGLCSAGRS